MYDELKSAFHDLCEDCGKLQKHLGVNPTVDVLDFWHLLDWSRVLMFAIHPDFPLISDMAQMRITYNSDRSFLTSESLGSLHSLLLAAQSYCEEASKHELLESEKKQ